jgi:hypothetical protein
MGNVLGALVVGLAGVLQEASVLDGDGLTSLGLSAGTLDGSVDSDAHVDRCGMEVAGKCLEMEICC